MLYGEKCRERGSDPCEYFLYKILCSHYCLKPFIFSLIIVIRCLPRQHRWGNVHKWVLSNTVKPEQTIKIEKVQNISYSVSIKCLVKNYPCFILLACYKTQIYKSFQVNVAMLYGQIYGKCDKLTDRFILINPTGGKEVI